MMMMMNTTRYPIERMHVLPAVMSPEKDPLIESLIDPTIDMRIVKLVRKWRANNTGTSAHTIVTESKRIVGKMNHNELSRIGPISDVVWMIQSLNMIRDIAQPPTWEGALYWSTYVARNRGTLILQRPRTPPFLALKARLLVPNENSSQH